MGLLKNLHWQLVIFKHLPKVLQAQFSSLFSWCLDYSYLFHRVPQFSGKFTADKSRCVCKTASC